MASSACNASTEYARVLGPEPTLAFDDEGFTFFIDGRTWKFHPHLWDAAASPRVHARETDRPLPALRAGGDLYGIDRWLTFPERKLTFGPNVSELIETYFRAAHARMNGAFAPRANGASSLTVIRPVLFSREPPDEGLAVVRLKGALQRAGFPEKQRWITPFQDLAPDVGDLLYYGRHFTQFRHDRKEVGIARGSADLALSPFPPELTLPFLGEARDRPELRSLFPFLREWEYLRKASPAGVNFLESPDALSTHAYPTGPTLPSPGDFARFGSESAHFRAELERFGVGKSPGFRKLVFT